MPALNINLSEDLLQRLREAKVQLHCRNWSDFLEKVLEGEGEVYVDFILIDDKPAKEHIILYQLGEYLYKYDKGNHTLLSSGNIQRFLKAFVGAGAPKQ